MYVIGKPVIQFVTSTIELFLLTDAPSFDAQAAEDFTAIKEEEVQEKVNENNELPSSELIYPVGGQQYGKILVSPIGLDVPLYFGDTDEMLRLGAGQFMGSVYPGEQGTSLIGGHNVDGFGKLAMINIGDEIQIQTTYGNYVFTVSNKEVANKDDKAINDLIYQRDKRIALLYTCYPIDSLGMTDERLFVTADYTSGPMINENE